MITRKKVQAFTLVEMIIVLIIASLIVALSFAVLNIVQRNLGNISNQFLSENSRNLLQSRLETNFMKYDESYYDEHEQQIIFKNKIDSIVYGIHHQFLTFDNDTIDYNFKKIYFLYKGDTIIDGPFDAIGILQKESAKKTFCYRINDAKAYLNGTEN